MKHLNTYNIFENTNAQADLQADILNSILGYNDLNINYILTPGVDLNYSIGEYSPLIAAVLRNNNSFAKRLIKLGADVNYENKFGVTALFTAANKGFNDCVTVLLAAGADIDHQDKNGFTALMNATYGGRLHTIKLLLEKGADPTLKNVDKESFIYPIYSNVGEWLGSYDVQKDLITKYPSLYSEFKRKKLIHDYTKTDFPELENATNLGLL